MATGNDVLTAAELARAAGYAILHVSAGGLDVREDIRLMRIGPDATDLDILRVAHRHLRGPAPVRSIRQLYQSSHALPRCV